MAGGPDADRMNGQEAAVGKPRNNFGVHMHYLQTAFPDKGRFGKAAPN